MKYLKDFILAFYSGGYQNKQTQLFIKGDGTINYVTTVSKWKPICSRILKQLFKSAIDIKDGLLDQLEEKDLLIKYRDASQSTCKVGKDLKNSTGIYQSLGRFYGIR